MRTCTAQGHSREVAYQYYKVTDQSRSAYEVVMGDTPAAPVPLSAATPTAPVKTPATTEEETAGAYEVVMGDTPAAPVPLSAATPTAPVKTPATAEEKNDELVKMAVKKVLESGAKRREDALQGALVSPSPSSPKKRKFCLEDGVTMITARAGMLQRVASSLSPFGSEHPEYESPSVRVSSSDEEKTWLFNYYNRNIDIYQIGGQRNLYKRCLDAIHCQNDARVLFHERHVLNSDRLKTCSLPVIREVKQFREGGMIMYPEWYIDTIDNVYAE